MALLMDRRACAPAEPQPRPPNRLAERITGRPYLSHSQLSLMRSCPRKFAFTYVEKSTRDFVPVSLIFGGSIQAALELHFRCRLEGWLFRESCGCFSTFSDGLEGAGEDFESKVLLIA